jgi:hypothetical protein
MLSAGVALLLREKGVNVKLGALHFYAASQHLYEDNWYKVDACLNGEILGDYEPIKLEDFNDYDHLVNHLWAVAYGTSKNGFLKEFSTWKG